MGKFSDPNYQLLQRYFNILVSREAGTQLSYLAGPRQSIWTDGGAFTVLYENDDTKGFVGHKFLIQEIDGNRFKMRYQGVYDDFKKYRTDTETESLSAIGVGNEMYFRKDSFFHAWLARSENIEFRNYVNQQRTFAFFGKLWPVSHATQTYAIEFEGLKDYTLRALPAHNQTTNLTEWLKVYFDQTHHEPYTMLKTLWSLMDAREIDLKWLGYIAQIYGIEIAEEMSELNIREWVDNLIYFLKRIGAYNALYIIYKLYLSNSKNVMNVYERWDEWCQPELTEIDDPTVLRTDASYDRFPGFHPGIPAGVRSYFGPEIQPINDYNWLEFYGQQPSGGAGILWYTQFNPDFYPVHTTEPPSGDCNSEIWDCGASNSFLCYDPREVNSFVSSIRTDTVNVSAYNTVDTLTRTLTLSGQAFSGDFEHCAGISMSPLTITNTSFIFYGLSNDVYGFGTTPSNWIGVAIERVGAQKRFAVYEKYGAIIYPPTLGIKTDYQTGRKYRIGIDRTCTSAGALLEVYIYDGKRREENLTEIIPHTLKECTDYTVLHAMNSFTNGLDGEFFGTVLKQHVDFSRLTTGVGPTGHPVITPHYIVELDLNTEPLIDVEPFNELFAGGDFIINEFLADELIRNWEYVRPVNKHVLYHELISPPAREERLATSIPLYPLDSNGYFNTFFTGSQFLSGAGPTPSAGVATFLHFQKHANKTWTINHGLGRYVVIQAWESLEGAGCEKNPVALARRVEPKNVCIIDDDTIELKFAHPINGWVTLAGEAWQLSYLHRECGCPDDTWTIFHDFEDNPSGGLAGYPSGIGPLVNFWLHPSSSSSQSSSSSSESSSSESSSSSSSSSVSSSSLSSSSSSSESSSSSSSESFSIPFFEGFVIASKSDNPIEVKNRAGLALHAIKLGEDPNGAGLAGDDRRWEYSHSDPFHHYFEQWHPDNFNRAYYTQDTIWNGDFSNDLTFHAVSGSKWLFIVSWVCSSSEKDEAVNVRFRNTTAFEEEDYTTQVFYPKNVAGINLPTQDITFDGDAPRTPLVPPPSAQDWMTGGWSGVYTSTDSSIKHFEVVYRSEHASNFVGIKNVSIFALEIHNPVGALPSDEFTFWGEGTDEPTAFGANWKESFGLDKPSVSAGENYFMISHMEVDPYFDIHTQPIDGMEWEINTLNQSQPGPYGFSQRYWCSNEWNKDNNWTLLLGARVTSGGPPVSLFGLDVNFDTVKCPYETEGWRDKQVGWGLGTGVGGAVNNLNIRCLGKNHSPTRAPFTPAFRLTSFGMLLPLDPYIDPFWGTLTSGFPRFVDNYTASAESSSSDWVTHVVINPPESGYYYVFGTVGEFLGNDDPANADNGYVSIRETKTDTTFVFSQHTHQAIVPGPYEENLYFPFAGGFVTKIRVSSSSSSVSQSSTSSSSSSEIPTDHLDIHNKYKWSRSTLGLSSDGEPRRDIGAAPLSAGSLMFAWTESPSGGVGTLTIRSVNVSGVGVEPVPIGVNIPIAFGSVDGNGWSGITRLHNGNYAIIYERWNLASAPIYGIIVNPSGGVVVPSFNIKSLTGGGNALGQMDCFTLNNGNWIALWDESIATAGYYQIFDENGVEQFTVPKPFYNELPTGGGASHPRGTALTNNHFCFVFHATDDDQIKFTKFRQDGHALTANLSCTATESAETVSFGGNCSPSANAIVPLSVSAGFAITWLEDNSLYMKSFNKYAELVKTVTIAPSAGDTWINATAIKTDDDNILVIALGLVGSTYYFFHWIYDEDLNIIQPKTQDNIPDDSVFDPIRAHSFGNAYNYSYHHTETSLDRVVMNVLGSSTSSSSSSESSSSISSSSSSFSSSSSSLSSSSSSSVSSSSSSLSSSSLSTSSSSSSTAWTEIFDNTYWQIGHFDPPDPNLRGEWNGTEWVATSGDGSGVDAITLQAISAGINFGWNDGYRPSEFRVTFVEASGAPSATAVTLLRDREGNSMGGDHTTSPVVDTITFGSPAAIDDIEYLIVFLGAGVKPVRVTNIEFR